MELKNKINTSETEALERVFLLRTDPSYLRSCLNVLTRLEQNIIKILYSKSGAMNVKEIRNTYIFWTYNSILRYCDSLEESNITRKLIIKNAEKKGEKITQENLDKINIHTILDKTTYENEIFELNWITIPFLPEEQIKSLLKEIDLLKKNKEKEKILSLYEKAEIMNKVFSKYHIEIPGFSTIKNSLGSLIKINLVIERKLEGKIKRLYFINPKFNVFFKKLSDQKKNSLKRKNKY